MSLYRRFHDRFGTAGVLIGVIALIVALGGTALAAGGLTKAQEKQVTKIAKKFAGKPGAPGAPGANGTNGTNGAEGKTGKTGESVILAAAGSCPEGGTKVTVGAESKEVCNGLKGNNGANGSNATFEYLFNTATSGDPTSKKLGLNNAAPGSATQVRLSETDNEGASGTNIAAAIAKWNSGVGALGTLMIRKVSSQATYAQYSISQNKDEGAFDSLTVKFIAGNGSFAGGDPVTAQYYATASQTLPPGQTEKGTWAFAVHTGTQVAGTQRFPISFSIPAFGNENGLGRGEAQYLDAEETEEEAGTGGCTGNALAPTAPPGKLCVYAIKESNENYALSGTPIVFPEGGPGFYPPGAFLEFTPENGANPGKLEMSGVWAVTAAEP